MVARRSGTRSVTVERPRQKGWWGAPEEDEIQDEGSETQPLLHKEETRRTPHPRAPRPVTPVGRALTPSQIEAIRAVMYLFVEEDLSRGVDPRSTLVCHRCAGPRRAAGSVRYDRFTFCNDCSTEFEIVRGRGLLDTAAEFLERFAPHAVSA